VDPSNLNLWDLSVFGRPTHPAFHSKKDIHGRKVIETMKCKYLHLSFPDHESKSMFEFYLRGELNRRDNRIGEQLSAERIARGLSNTVGISKPSTSPYRHSQHISPRTTIVSETPPQQHSFQNFNSYFGSV